MSRLTEQLMDYPRPDGQMCRGFLVQAAEPGPAVVVIQEWWGLNDQIKGVARRLASAGYTALVPDLYRGRSTVEAEEAHHLMSGLDFGAAASQDIRGAAQWLKARFGKVGVTGFCMGGALTLLTMTTCPEVDAGCVWYGFPPLEFIDASRIKAPLIAHWAEQDQAFPISTVDELEKKLAGSGASYVGYRYLAQHAFANETAQGPGRIAMTQYDVVWAQVAWDRTFRFFGRVLG